MKTWNAKKWEIPRAWWLISAEKQSLGRLAGQTALLLRGKHKPEFTPHRDTGDFVIIINASKVRLTGRKWTDKKYFSHSGFFGSLKEKSAKELTHSTLIHKAVFGMLPKNKMRKKLIKKLKIYETAEHPHSSQKPMMRNLNSESQFKAKKPTELKRLNAKAHSNDKKTLEKLKTLS